MPGGDMEIGMLCGLTPPGERERGEWRCDDAVAAVAAERAAGLLVDWEVVIVVGDVEETA